MPRGLPPMGIRHSQNRGSPREQATKAEKSEIFIAAAHAIKYINQGVGGRQLWGALSLELWHQRFIDAH